MSIYKYDSTQDELIPLAGGVLYADVPVGTIMPYGGSNPVDGFLLCQGQAVNRTTYAELFKVIGTAFGAGDGSTTFNVPDLRETVPVGVGENDVQTIAEHDVYTLGEFKDDQIQNIGKMKANATNGYSVVSGGIAGYITSNSALRTGTTTHGKQLGVNYIIKATQVGAPADFAPVDVVEDGNMKAVTSNAVYDAISQIKTETKARYKALSFNSISGVTFAKRDNNPKALSATRVDNIIVLNYSITVQGTYTGTSNWLPIFNVSQLDSLLDDDEVLNDSVTPYFCSGITYTNDASLNKLDGVMNGCYLYFYNSAVFNMGIQGQIILGVQKTS